MVDHLLEKQHERLDEASPSGGAGFQTHPLDSSGFGQQQLPRLQRDAAVR